MSHNSTLLVRVQSVSNCCSSRLIALIGSTRRTREPPTLQVSCYLSREPQGWEHTQATQPVSTNPQKDIRDLQRELDKEQGQERKAIVKTASNKNQKAGSFDAIAVAVIGLVLSAVAVVSVGRMSEVDRRALAIGLISGAIGLAVGYGVGRIRR